MLPRPTAFGAVVRGYAAALLKLFFVRADNTDGGNLDLLVAAEHKEPARKVWSDRYEADDDAPDWIDVVPGVPPVCEPGPIKWDAIRMD